MLKPSSLLKLRLNYNNNKSQGLRFRTILVRWTLDRRILSCQTTNISSSYNFNNFSNSNNTKKCSNSNSWCLIFQAGAQWTRISTNGTSNNNMTRWWVTPSTQVEAILKSQFPTLKAASRTKLTKQAFLIKQTTLPERTCLRRYGIRACTNTLSRWETGRSLAASTLTILWPWTPPSQAARAAHMQMAAIRWAAPTFQGIWTTSVSKQTRPCNWTRQNERNRWMSLTRFISKYLMRKKGENSLFRTLLF